MCWLRCIIHNISDAEATNLSKSSLLKMHNKEITIKNRVNDYFDNLTKSKKKINKNKN